MEKDDELLEQYTDKNKITEIFELINKNRIIKTRYFYDRILFRDIDEELINKIFPLSEKIKLINKRKHKEDIGYDIHYELEPLKTLILGFIPLRDKTLLINAIIRYRRWQSSIKS